LTVREKDKQAARKTGLSDLWEVLRAKLRFLLWQPAFRKAPIRVLGRLLVWRIRCWLGIPAVIGLPRYHAKFFLPARWGGEGTTLIYIAREDFELELAHLDRFISPGSVAVDAGANCGIYTVVAARLVGDTGKVIAFEPGERTAPVLEHNIELNGLSNVRLYRDALADRDGKARLYHHEGPVARSIAAGDSRQDEFDEVSTITLDSVAQREGIPRIDFLKLDIEGAEELALRGAELVLSKSHPVVVFEINPSAVVRFGLATDGAWRHLHRLAYLFFALDTTGRLEPLYAPPTEDLLGFRNIVAIHEDSRDRFLETR
jgi:FkbM family methyltransferase